MATTKKETRLNIRIDPELKEAAQDVASDMGIDLSAAVNMFIVKMVKDHALPFTPTSLPVETLQALKEAKHSDKLKKYRTPDDMWEDLDV
ncbi:Damage inducible-like protein [Lacticaseibacillus zeae DSM 20178 = KCTC 3804]|jgi:DNA-damage-inducible protein J|uniref:Type II toxin-antitoxin system RelB/DinJ family antitoxin n=2 Tax=Lacticaseibacillus zeae TaxID=57037 RepID=A0A5R8LUF5_LACZE|nr:type II toxin-antitoxin system RelB/DinJ family antitoxin [Lacticaseibacillus zeae]KRK11642.1 Damage inducible-like protein [Lacticaseibacillus zeae DSM 20178 = KCTC 3804]OLS06899.1 damage-inducible protein [Lacticaseibacillus casei]QVI31869.1 type II toxin-antitoxin system RelB/DinJ family antitoxin [Lacticaseibacillus zeae]TLF40891.1 type II toxin-antitoxin system RelB/DinJ family antitoxin [Lacticaseibacillus zeae]